MNAPKKESNLKEDMKKLLFLIIFLSVLSAPETIKAENNFIVNDFKSNIEIQSDGKLMVEETINVSFYEPSHGIYRDLPYVYKTAQGEKKYTRIEITDITDGNKKIPYKTYKNQANLQIKIGDPDKTVTGSQQYVIEYLVSGVLVPFENYDELYWNITGNDWPVSIEESSAIITLPQDGIIQSSCSFGEYGANDSCIINRISGSKIEFTSPRSLSAGEGLTVAVGYEKGMVPMLSIEAPKTFFQAFSSQGNLISFFLTLILGTFFLLRMWWFRGRDYYFERKSLHDLEQKERIMPLKAYEPIVPEYEPPLNLRPGEIGVIMDERADILDISATIVDLAVRGYLIIKEEPKKWGLDSTDYTLIRTEKKNDDLLEYEKELIDKLFSENKEVKLSDLKTKFYVFLQKIKDLLYKDLVSKKIFDNNPQSVRAKYLFFAIALATLSFIGTLIIFKNIPDSFLLGICLGLFICGMLFIFISLSMPRKTAFGREMYRKARGYKLFVSGTEKYRQPFFEKKNIFMDVLPYAMIFGVTDKLAKAMKEMGIEPAQPSWYVGATAFNVSRFTSDVNSFSNSFSSVIASYPSGSGSGGGGFSGGGFGGGGGGSW